MKCLNCGYECDDSEKFCSKCAEKLVIICANCKKEYPLGTNYCSECGLPLGNGGISKGANGSIQMGDKNVVAGDVIGGEEADRLGGRIHLGDKNVVAGDIIGEKYVLNGNASATFIKNEDQTKQMKECHVCGKQIQITEAISCPVCRLMTCKDHFNVKANKCLKCFNREQEEKKQEYLAALQEVYEDGKVDVNERERLTQLRQKLGLSQEETDQWESQIRMNIQAQHPQVQDDGFVEDQLTIAERLIFDEWKIDDALRILSPLHEKYSAENKVTAEWLYAKARCASCSLTELKKSIPYDIPALYLVQIDDAIKREDFTLAKELLSEASGKWPDEYLIKCRTILFDVKLYWQQEKNKKYLKEGEKLFKSLKGENGKLERSWGRYVQNALQEARGERVPEITVDYCRKEDLYFFLAYQKADALQKKANYMLNVEKNQTEYFRYLTLAPESGTVSRLLGDCYLKGIGVARNADVAVKCYVKADEAKEAGMKILLGDLFRDGKDVPQDYSVAQEWYLKAVGGGDPEARKRLEEPNTSGRTIGEEIEYQEVRKASEGFSDFAEMPHDEQLKRMIEHPEYAKYMDLTKFTDGELVGLLARFPQIARLENVQWNTLDAGLLETLLELSPLSLCCKNNNWGALTGEQWAHLLQEFPELSCWCNFAKMSSSDITELLLKQPSMSYYCAWQNLDSVEDIRRLIKERPECFLDCNYWTNITEELWLELQKMLPALRKVKYSKREQVNANPDAEENPPCYWTNRFIESASGVKKNADKLNLLGPCRLAYVLQKQPGIVEYCRMEEWNSSFWRYQLFYCPDLFRFCLASKIGYSDWKFLSMFYLDTVCELYGKIDLENTTPEESFLGRVRRAIQKALSAQQFDLAKKLCEALKVLVSDEKIYQAEKAKAETEEKRVNDALSHIIFKINGTHLEKFLDGNAIHAEIPEGITDIDASAFAGNKKLKSISLPSSLRVIHASAFQGCSSLSEIAFNEGLENIDRYAFCECSALCELHLPHTLTTISKGAFGKCSGLVSVFLPESLKNIQNCAFAECGSLSSVLVDEDFDYRGLPPITCVGSIGKEVFACSPGLKYLKIPYGIKFLDCQCFCSSASDHFKGWSDDWKDLHGGRSSEYFERDCPYPSEIVIHEEFRKESITPALIPVPHAGDHCQISMRKVSFAGQLSGDSRKVKINCDEADISPGKNFLRLWFSQCVVFFFGFLALCPGPTGYEAFHAEHPEEAQQSFFFYLAFFVVWSCWQSFIHNKFGGKKSAIFLGIFQGIIGVLFYAGSFFFTNFLRVEFFGAIGIYLLYMGLVVTSRRKLKNNE